MVNVYLTQDDNNVPVDFTVYDQTGAIVPLTNTSNNTFQMWPPNSLINTTNTSMTIQSAAGGVIRQTFYSQDTANAGVYNAQISLFYKAGNTSGREITIGSIQVIITGESTE